MTDEANPIYFSSIDNIVEGFNFLKKELGASFLCVVLSNEFLKTTIQPPCGQTTRLATAAPSLTCFTWQMSIEQRFKGYITVSRSASLESSSCPGCGSSHLVSVLSIYFSNKNPTDTGLKDGVLTHLLPGPHYDIPNTCGPSPSVCCQFDFKRLTSSYGCPGPRPVQITEKNVQER